MKAKELAALLNSLGKAYIDGGLRKSAPPLNTLVADLQTLGELDIPTVRKRLLQGDKPGGKKRSSSRKSPKLRIDVVNQYVSDFEIMDGKRFEFNECLSRLKLDKRVRVGQELKEILSKYSGGALTGSNKKNRLEQMEKAYIIRQTKLRNREIASSAKPF